MYQPKISELIARLEQVKADHGDIPVQGYDESAGRVADEVDAEFNNDEGEFCLITFDYPND